jgi:hypothetical protein
MLWLRTCLVILFCALFITFIEYVKAEVFCYTGGIKASADKCRSHEWVLQEFFKCNIFSKNLFCLVQKRNVRFGQLLPVFLIGSFQEKTDNIFILRICKYI